MPTALVKWVGRFVDSSATPKFVQQNAGHDLKFDNERSRQRLDIDYIPLQQTFVEHFQQLLDDGIIRAKN